MKPSPTVNNLVLHAILFIIMSAATANEANTANNSTDNRRALRDRLLSRKNAISVATLDTQTINEGHLVPNIDSNKMDDILDDFVQKVSTSKKTISNLTKLIDNSAEVENGNKKSSVAKRDIDYMEDDVSIEKREIKNKNVHLNDDDGSNRMGELKNKFMPRSGKPVNRNSSVVTTIIIGANELGDFKRNFKNLLRGSLAEPLLTTVIKTKSVLKDNKWITATEKSFIYYRDQTKPPEISETTTNSQQFRSEEVTEKAFNIEPDSHKLSYVNAGLRSIDDDTLPSSCAEIMKQNFGAPDGVHTIYVFGYGPTEVYCFADPVGTGCAWTVFMRRVNTGDSFDRNFEEYKFGFGDSHESFFLGLDRIYGLTAETKQELGIFTKFETNDIEVEKYSYFVLGGEETGYRVEELGAFSKTSAISRLTRFVKFSARDRDNGVQYNKCAQVLGMGWWYSDKCKSAIKLSGVRAYVNAPTIMGLRPTNCRI
ncbi:angiopoietin-related protein 3-like [Bactrocera neohumeralis]|uniref:angiopoietin-related protein 3-like n=1 Tax=Bactrocera neohumeralis TaxID=98809 RepID=UPI002165F1EC|nr:angiopoietin-related protein 3-like [Bactrocera neohumeralis]